jgi:NNP family nitrate/nitrite transporter-like MFS transporter
MAGFRGFLRSGHPPTLFAAFLYFDFCFAIWVLNGAMAPFISKEFDLSPAEKGFMISVPILSGALLRFPLGVLAQYIGRKNAALLEMGMIVIALGYGYLFVDTYREVLIMGVLLGIAGASFGVALSLGAGWFPPQHKGLAMGITGAGNSGTVLAVLFAPPLATIYGWQAVYGFGALFMLVPIAVMVWFAKEPPDIEKQTLKEHVACLWEKDGWVFNLIYIVTFGGFIGLSNFLPTYFHDQFGVSPVVAGQLTMLAALMGSGIRIVGGYIADRWGGVNTLTTVFGVIVVTMGLAVVHEPHVVPTTFLFMICFAALGAGNGALFQLVPLRWPKTTAVAGSMIGEVGALGGGIIPNAMGLSKEYTGDFAGGFAVFVSIAVIAVVTLRVAQRRWVRTWVEAGGRARAVPAPAEDLRLVMGPAAPRAPAVGGVAYRTIVYPVGGDSELADAATRQAAFLAKTTGATLALVHVSETAASLGPLATNGAWKATRDDWLREARALLDREAERLAALGVQAIEKVVLEGRMADEVAALAEDRKADLIVLASQKRSPIGRLLMGSRTYDLFTRTPCPILRIVR